MVLRIQYLKYHISGGYLVPYFLVHQRDTDIAQRLIAHLEDSVGLQRRDVDLTTPETWMPDVRVIKALIATALMRFFTFIPQRLNDLLTKDELVEVRHQDITSLQDFRLQFWRFVQEQYNGFIPRSLRTQALNQAAQKFRLSNADEMERLLTAHRDEHMILSRQGVTPSAQDYIAAYNFEVLETLLYNSESVAITISGESLGSAARALLQVTKRFGVLVDLEQTDGGLRANITGPRVFFGRASPFGWNIAQVLTRFLKEATRFAIQLVDITLEVILRDRHYVVHLTPETIPPFLPRGDERTDEAFLDSKVEKQFYWSFSAHKFRGWDIVREPDALVVGKRLIVPDFALIKGDWKVLVEIIGYWREEYTQKKLDQLQALHNFGLKNLILLVDSKHRRHFAKSLYPVIFYKARGRRYEIPYGKILKVLPK